MVIGNTTIEVVRDSVTNQKVDAIVNAANTSMRGGGGIDGVIHKLAGKALLDELKRVAPRGAKTSEAVVTGGHNLRQQYVIHVAGPYYKLGLFEEKDQLRLAYKNSLIAANNLKLQSIAFCSISTGLYLFPIDKAAPIAITAAIDFVKDDPETPLQRIVFAMYQHKEFDVFSQALAIVEDGQQ